MLIVVADQHIGSGATLGDRLADQRSSWVRVCTTAAEHGATVLHAGDVFHARRASPSEMRAFQAGLDILREGDCELIVALGNHDRVDMDSPTSVEAASAGYAVHVCREPEVIETPDGVVGFLPWMPPRMSAKQTSDALMIVVDSLAEEARILIAHWALAGGSLPNGLPLLDLAEPMLDPYALSQLFEITLAGHIHKRQEIIDTPLVAHTGPLNRHSFGEAGIWTGAWQVDANGALIDGLPATTTASWFEVPDRRFFTMLIDTRNTHEPQDYILNAISEDAEHITDAIVRMRYQQTADQSIDSASIREALLAAGAHHIERIEPVVERAQSTRSESVTETVDPRQAWDAWQDAQPDLASEEALASVREEAHTRIARGA